MGSELGHLCFMLCIFILYVSILTHAPSSPPFLTFGARHSHGCGRLYACSPPGGTQCPPFTVRVLVLNTHYYYYRPRPEDYLRELVRDGHVKLLKCAGPQNVADALTKSPPRPALTKHRQYMWGTRIPFSVLYLSLKTGRPPTASYNIITPCGYQVARAA
jgi:hypothetical protein